MLSPIAAFGVDSIRQNNVSLPKYNYIIEDSGLFDRLTSVQLPPIFTEHPVTGELCFNSTNGNM